MPGMEGAVMRNGKLNVSDPFGPGFEWNSMTTPSATYGWNWYKASRWETTGLRIASTPGWACDGPMQSAGGRRGKNRWRTP